VGRRPDDEASEATTMRQSRFPILVAALALLGLLGAVAACGGGDDPSGDATAGADRPDPEGADLDGTLTVLAAASLTDGFDEIGDRFEQVHPGVTVELAYDGSSALRDQILAGAPADVFAAADPAPMAAVVDGDGTEAPPETFATNELEIAVPAGNEAGVDGLASFGDESLLVGLCAEEVPCGALGRQVLARAGVTPAPDTDEPDVRSLLDKVASGELDAGLVYATDVAAAGTDVEGIEIPDEDNVTATYPIAPLAASGHPAAARAFVAFVLSDEGRSILGSHGFGPPSPGDG
jgi:molybdate transport system substrate-binding protein